MLWHSRDLVNWVPLCAALKQVIGSVWAMDLVRHRGRYVIRIPTLRAGTTAIYVIYADAICGPWSAPIDLKIPGAIDPGHAVGEDGKRYLFVNGVRRIQLADDGLSTVGELEHVYDPWRYPEDWVVEVSGLHHNVFGGFSSLKFAVFAAGSGEVRLRNFGYRGL